MKRKKNFNGYVDLDIESIAFQGMALARKDKIVHFVKGAVPGDKVKAKILHKKRNYIETQLEEIYEPSADRIKPECMHFGPCGGCSWQQLEYDKQLYWKKQHIIDSFERIGKVSVGMFKDTLPSPKTFKYRNKMEFSFGASRWLTEEEVHTEGEVPNKHFAAGLHIPGRFDKVLDIRECLIQPEIGNSILNTVRNKALELGCLPYNTRKHNGFLRNLVIRSTKNVREIMVILVTTTPGEDNEKRMIDWLRDEFTAEFPEVNELYHAVNDKPAQVAVGDITKLKGEGFITDSILDVEYRISPFSFFQTNSYQLDQFISMILETAGITYSNVVWDLYCGTGSITLPAARRAEKIIGLEVVESSIKDAKSNAELNGIDNVEFFCTDLHSKDIEGFLDELPRPDIIIVDPPRAGMHKNLVEKIVHIAPERIVYISCNPTTQARDCELMSQLYNVRSVQPVDMFPHTFHVESIALLERTF